MGNGGSSTLVLEMDRTHFFSGSQLSGTLHMNITLKDLPTISHISLFFAGCEKTQIERKKTKTSGTVRYYSSQPLVNMEEMIMEEGSVRAGQFSMPFSFKIPDGLPSSMEAKAFGDYAKVEYTLMARIRRPGFHRDNKKSLYVSVRSSPLVCSDDAPIWMNPVTMDVKKGLVFGQGTLICAAKIQRSIVQADDMLMVSFSCKNQSKRNVKSVSVKLLETIRWKASMYHQQTSRSCGIVTLDASQIPGTKKLEEGTLSKNDPEMRGLLEEVYRSLVDRPSTTNLRIEGDILDSFAGKYITVTHELVISFNTGGTVTKDPAVTFNITVGHRVLPNGGMQQMDQIQQFPDVPSFALPDDAGTNQANAGAGGYDPSLDYKKE